MNSLNKFKPYIIFIILTLIVGSFAGFLASDSMIIFERLDKPPLTPPGYIFPIVWTILYILMGISASIIYKSNSDGRNYALVIYIVQLVVNFMWSIIFFNLQAYLFAFIWLQLLLGLIILMISNFYKINKLAAYLQIPYLIWVSFAGYLNLMIYILNR